MPPADGPGPLLAPVVVITGASAGVGRAVAQRFAKDGAKIALIARGEERLNETKRDVEKRGGQAIVFPLDVTNHRGIEGAATETERVFGPIDIWINNAMTSVFSEVTDMHVDEYERVMAVNFTGVVNGTLAALRRMTLRNRGTIVIVGSALAYRGIPLQSAYCASKHALLGFHESLRCELLHNKSQVHVAMVHLPALNTPQFLWVRNRFGRKTKPVAPIYQPEVAAEAIHWAAHRKRREIFVGDSVFLTVWGNRFVSGLLDRYLAAKGYEAQLTDTLEEPNRPDNLWAPTPAEVGAHGPYDREASAYSFVFCLTRHRNAALSIILVVVILLVVVIRKTHGL